MKYLLFVFTCLLFVSCAPDLTRFNYKKPTNIVTNNCNIRILLDDTTLKNVKPIVRGRFKDNGFINSCSEFEIIELIRLEACQLGGNLVNLTKIEKPDFSSQCFRTYYDIYKVDDNLIPKNNAQKENSKNIIDNSDLFSKLKKYDTLNMNLNYHEIGFSVGFGGGLSGSRYDLPKVVLDVIPDGLSILSYGAKYAYIDEWWGIDAGFDYLSLSSTKTNYKPLNFYDDFNFSIGGKIIPTTFKTNTFWWQLFANGGLIYNSFKSTKDIPSENDNNFVNGYGYYFGGGFNIINNNLMYSFILDYQKTSSKETIFNVGNVHLYYTPELSNLLFRIVFSYRFEKK